MKIASFPSFSSSPSSSLFSFFSTEITPEHKKDKILASIKTNQKTPHSTTLEDFTSLLNEEQQVGIVKSSL